MKHSFNGSRLDTIKCSVCSRSELEHGITECESCGTMADCELSNNILLCPSCLELESNTPIVSSSVTVLSPTEKLDATMKRIAELVREIDGETPLRSREEFWNAETVSLHEIKERIESDPTIEDKSFTLAKVAEANINKLRAIIMHLGATRVSMVARAEANQVFLNEVVTKLKLEQRAQFKESDLRYKAPEPVKKPAKTKVPKLEKIVQSVYNAVYAKLVDNGKIDRDRAIKLAEQQVANMLQGAGGKK